MKKNNKLVTILLASSLLLPGIAPLATGVTSVSAATETVAADKEFEDEYIAFTDQVVRFQAVDNATEVAFLEAGDRAEFVAKIDLNWFKVKVGGVVGYVERGNMTSEENYNKTDYSLHDVTTSVVPKDNKDYVVAVKTPLRTGNANRFRPIKTMDRASEVEYKGTSADGQWFKVEHEETLGFVHRSDVTTVENFEAGGEAEDRILDSEGKLEGSLRSMIDTSIRTQPGKQYRVIDEVKRNDMVDYVGTVRGNKDWLRVKLEDKTEGYIYRGDVTKQGVEEETEEGLVVESVSAITETYVTVEIKEATEDSEEPVTVEVKDSEGKVRAVKPVSLIKGDKSVDFEFDPAVKTEDLKGVWTVDGVEYDIDEVTNLDIFETETDQFKFKKALEDLGIEGIEVDNIPAYIGARAEFLKDLKDDKEELTVEAVQEFITEQNEKIAEKDTSQEAKDAAAKAVVEAYNAKNDIKLKAALENDLFERFNSDWLAAYKSKFQTRASGEDNKLDAKTTTVENIQADINSANTTKVQDSTNVVTLTGVDKAKLTASKALIETYATRNDKGELEAIDKNNVEKIEIQLAIVDVRDAATPTRLKPALEKLAELTKNETTKFDMEDYKEENARYYINGLDKNELADGEPKEAKPGIKGFNKKKGVATVENINIVIGDINDAVSGAQTNINDRITKLEVTFEYTPDYNSSALGREARLLGYNMHFGLAEDLKISDTESVVMELYKGKTLLGKQKLNETGYKKFVEKPNRTKNGTLPVATDYVSSSWDHEWYGETTDLPDNAKVIVEFKDGVAEKTKKVTVDDNFKKILHVVRVNDAETLEEMNQALLALTNVGEDRYLNAPKADRMFIAEEVMDVRDDKDVYKGAFSEGDKESYTKLKEELDKIFNSENEGSYAAALKAVNELKPASTTNNVIAALSFDKDFAKKGIAEKAEIAEAFFNGLEFKEDELKTPFRSLAAVKEAAGL